MSQIAKFPTLNHPIETIIGNDGIQVPPFYDPITMTFGINLIGAGHVTVTGNVATSTLTIDLDGGIADLYPTDAGIANPIGGVLNIFGGSNINTAGAANTVTINLDDTVHITGSMTADLGFTATTGNFTALAGNLVLPATNAAGTEGQIILGALPFLQGIGAFNVFVGPLAGNLTMLAAAQNNSGFGAQSLLGLTTGANNTGIGATALNAITTGSYNIALGYQAGISLTLGDSSNIMIGHDGVAGDDHTIRLGTDGNGNGEQDTTFIAGDTTVARSITSTIGNITATLGNVVITAGNLTLPDTNGAGTEGEITFGGVRWVSNFGTDNTFVGEASGNTTVTGIDNSGFGARALDALTTGAHNTGIGYQSETAITTGSNNTALGDGSLSALLTGSDNIGIGLNAGTAYVGAESSNIMIGNIGVIADANTIRLGTDGNGAGQQTDCYIAGNTRVTRNLMLPNTNGAGTVGEIQFNSIRWVSDFGTRNVFVGPNSGNTTNTGADDIGIGSATLSLLTTGTDNIALGSTALTNILTGSNNIAIGSTAGTAYTGAEASNICIGNVGVIADANKIRLGTDGNGAGQQTDAYIAGNTHITRNLMLPDTNAAGTVGEIQFNAIRWISNFGTANAFVGYASGNTTLTVVSSTNNTALGTGTLAALTTGAYNVALGSYALPACTTGSFNVGIGYQSLLNYTGVPANGKNIAIGYQALTTLVDGQYNVAIGHSAGVNLGAGAAASYNIFIGESSGFSYTGTEHSNILISNAGVLGESHIMRLGTTGVGDKQVSKCFIAGTTGVTPDVAGAKLMIIDTSGQVGSLGTATNGQLPIGSTGANPVLGNITSNYLTVTNGAGTISIETKAVLQTDTGWATWGGAGNYFDDTTLGSFTILRPGTGYINGLPITWAAPQTVAGMVAGNNYYIYIDNAGIIQKTNARTDALFQNNIVLFECLRDSTLVNNQVTVKENHPFTMPVETSNYIHNTVGSVIENYQNGANITLNGTQGIQINGADTLADHGLYTTIPDSGGVAVTWNRYYTNAGGAWARQNATTTFTGFYNNAGAPTALTANKYGIYTLYASKDNLTTATPVYFAILDTSEYNSLNAVNTAIGNRTTAIATNELASLELCQLGYIIYSQASASIVEVIISKSTIRSTLSTAGTNTASLVNTNTTNFNHVLSAADTNVQAALDTLDNAGFIWSVITVNQTAAINSGYICNKAGLLTLTLPAASAVGTTLAVTGMNTAVGWRIAQGAGQTIHSSAFSTTPGAGGYLESTSIYDSIMLVCNVANTDWVVVGAPNGNITCV